MLIFFDSSSEINIIYLIFAKEFRLFVKPIEVGAQKIDGITLNIYGMLVAIFSMTKKINQIRFFEKTLLVVNITLKAVFGIFFLILNNPDVDFLDYKLYWKNYTI